MDGLACKWHQGLGTHPADFSLASPSAGITPAPVLPNDALSFCTFINEHKKMQVTVLGVIHKDELGQSTVDWPLSKPQLPSSIAAIAFIPQSRIGPYNWWEQPVSVDSLDNSLGIPIINNVFGMLNPLSSSASIQVGAHSSACNLVACIKSVKKRRWWDGQTLVTIFIIDWFWSLKTSITKAWVACVQMLLDETNGRIKIARTSIEGHSGADMLGDSLLQEDVVKY
ncbi:hypothetical protein DFH29DRAFT_877197 [Suillus ampliporus]|nr:hypothetical protein DFH29DRAFT_877197 [Suillus ampliporus]